jgi:hypothetical protein
MPLTDKPKILTEIRAGAISLQSPNVKLKIIEFVHQPMTASYRQACKWSRFGEEENVTIVLLFLNPNGSN